jgi:hypothetical protein
MSNEKIDLTQFEKMFEVSHPKHLFEEVEKRFNDGGVKTQPLYLNEAYVNAITMLPELIAELKKMYEREGKRLNEFQKMSARIDGLRDILSILEDRHNIDMSQFENYFASE